MKLHVRLKDPAGPPADPKETPVESGGWTLPEPLSQPYIGLINRIYRWVLVPAVGFTGLSAYTSWYANPAVAFVSAYQTGVLLVLWLALRLRPTLTLVALRTALYSIYAGFIYELLANYASTPTRGTSEISGHLGLALFGLAIFIIGAHTVHSPAGARLATFSMWLISTLAAAAGVVLAAYYGHPFAELALLSVRFGLGGLIAFGMPMIFSHLYGLHVRLQAERSLLKRYALTDSLTGLPNRLAFETTLERDYTLALRTRNPLSLIMLDLDMFKRVNDTYGHNRGDSVLAQLAQVLNSVIRGSDHPARWGGEEFVIVLPNSNAGDARILAERIRAAVEKADFKVGRLTVSLGVAQLQTSDSPISLVRRADEALYRAKAGGRNRVECDDDYLPPRRPEGSERGGDPQQPGKAVVSGD